MKKKFIYSWFFLGFSFCLWANDFSVVPTRETEPVQVPKDAVDDVAVWYNEESPEQSLLITTNKTKGMAVYGLQGHLVSEYKKYAYNNVDLRSVFDFKKNKKVILIAANNKETKQIDFFTLKEKKLVKLEGFLFPKVRSYGLCMLSEKKEKKSYVVVTGRRKDADLFKVWLENGEVKHKFVKTLSVSSKNEGCVGDDETDHVYIAEEKGSIWRFAIKKKKIKKILVDSKERNSNLAADIEGLALYYTKDKKGYLLASVQGKSEFAVYNKETLEYLKSFKIERSPTIDGVSGTDGIEIVSKNLGAEFPMGIFIAQDDSKDEFMIDSKRQNFKIVNWNDIQFSLD